ncbi:MAG TPA: S41 family peptidase [Acidobacteriota bacterium]|nr:S41 family peptidase [Acidobacteriota bacterium]
MDLRSAMKNIPRYRWFLLAAFVGAGLFFVIQMGLLPGGRPAQAPRGFDLLESLMRLIRNDYLEERDPMATSEGTYRGLVNSLDPLSAYLPKELAAAFKARTGAETEPGVVVLKRYAAFPQVVAVVPKSPAEAAGIKVGDLLSGVAGKSALDMSLAEVKLLLQGHGPDPVKLRVLRGNETFELDVPRALLFPRPWTLAQAPGKPAVLSVRRIVPGLAAEIKKTVVPALKGQAGGLVLDLRSAQDGDLEEAAKLANLFIKAADAGRFEGRGGEKTAVALPDEPALKAVPLVIWTDPGTAGPAELAAGLVQELRKTKVVGFETPGLVGRRTLFQLDDGSAVLLAASVYALPSGRKLWDEGVKPDVPIPADKLDEKNYLEKSLPLLAKR